MECILFREENGIGYITLNRPDKANAMIAELKKELTDTLRAIRGDNSIRVVVITGNGKFFCAGGDLSTMGKNQTAVEGRDRMKFAVDWLKELVQLEKPTIAAVNGAAYGGGLSLALACDIIIASASAKLSCSFIKVGLVADTGTLYFLPRRIGLGKAKLFAFMGEPLIASEAEKWGLVDRTVPAEELNTVVEEYAVNLSKSPTYAIGLTKNLINQSYETNLTSFLDLEASSQAVAFQTADHINAVTAFFEKSTPQFIGR